MFNEGNITKMWSGLRQPKGVQKHWQSSDNEESLPWDLKRPDRAVYRTLERTTAGTLQREEPPSRSHMCRESQGISILSSLCSPTLLSWACFPSSRSNRKPEDKGVQGRPSTGVISQGTRESGTVDLEETDRDYNQLTSELHIQPLWDLWASDS